MPDLSQHPEQSLPTGTVTFLFTDIEGSTKLWEKYPDAMKTALARHDEILRAAIEAHGGYVFKTVGDAFCAAFATAPDALEAALEAQRALSTEQWGETGPLKVRSALHTGAAEERGGDYFGSPLNRVARLLSAGHGGQILLSLATQELARDHLPEGVSLRDMGEHRLKDLQRPERLFQVVISDLPYDFPPLKSLDTLPNNLPVQLTSFVGREREITEVKRLLTTTRLLTFTGAGGCGKTRLALQVAVDVLEDYTNGVWLVELAPLSDPSLIPQVVAGALRVREQPGQPILSTLSDYLRSKQMILVLDNCEHLIAECAKLTDAFLHASPSLKILATSREGLGIGGELTYRVPSLSIPDLKNLPPVENLSQYEAVRLFIERAIFSQPTFAVTNQNAPAVAQICHKLDGIPLAIELAAARVKVLPVEQIAKRLDDSFRLLTGGSRTALPRQQTLRAAIDWSYNLLSEAERALLRRLSVFAGGWILEAAEAICADLPLPPARGGRERAGVRVSGIHPDETLDLLTHLVDKSLVVMECEGGEGRYRLLETVRQYARDKLLESGEAADLRGRHRDWYLSLAEQSEPELRRRDQVAWLERLEAEHDNIRAALEWSLGGGEVEAGLRIAGAIQWFWFLRAHRIEGHEWLTRLMTKNADVSASVRAKALIGAGNIATGYGDHNRAMTLCEEGLALYRELGDREGIAKSLSILGVVEYSRSNYGQAAILCEENLALYRELGNKEGIALTLNLLGDSARLQGQYERATTLFEENLALSRELGDTLGIALSARGLGMVKLHQGDYKRATELFKEDLMRCREMKDEVGVVISLINLGDAARCQDDYDRAAALYEESLALCRETGYTVLWWGPEVILRRVGRVALHRGHYDRATEIFKEGLSLFRKRGDKRSIVECLEGLAAVAGAEGQPERAARLYGVAEALRKAIDVSLTPSFFPPLPPDRADHDRSVAAARAGLGEEAFKAAWEEGRRMKIEEAVQLAVGGGQ